MASCPSRVWCGRGSGPATTANPTSPKHHETCLPQPPPLPEIQQSEQRAYLVQSTAGLPLSDRPLGHFDTSHAPRGRPFRPCGSKSPLTTHPPQKAQELGNEQGPSQAEYKPRRRRDGLGLPPEGKGGRSRVGPAVGQDTHTHTHKAAVAWGKPHQPRVPDGDDEVKVGFQARLLGWGVLLHLSHSRGHSHGTSLMTLRETPCPQMSETVHHHFRWSNKDPGTARTVPGRPHVCTVKVTPSSPATFLGKTVLLRKWLLSDHNPHIMLPEMPHRRAQAARGGF